MKIAVFGLGKIGLPLAVQFARKGHSVVGIDLSQERVGHVKAGYAPDFDEEDLPEALAAVVASGHLDATVDAAAAVRQCDALVVAVPLYVHGDHSPDFSAIDSVTRIIGDNVAEGSLISFETTLPVGTTRNRIMPEIARRSGLNVGQDIHLVFSPERVFAGRIFRDLRRYPKLVGGVSPACEEKGKHFYESVLDFEPRADLPRGNGVWSMGSAEAAEFAKLAETTYRDVNIALANQFAIFAQNHDLDIYRVIEACNSQPFSQIHSPGVAVGGHCIPVYPRLFLWGDPHASIVREARAVNDSMPRVVANRLADEINGLHGKKVLILGVAYRGGVKESAYSGVFALRDALRAKGATVVVHDPLFSAPEVIALGLAPYEPADHVDAAILQAGHPDYLEWRVPWKLSCPVIMDGRGLLPRETFQNARVVTLGVGPATS